MSVTIRIIPESPKQSQTYEGPSFKVKGSIHITFIPSVDDPNGGNNKVNGGKPALPKSTRPFQANIQARGSSQINVTVRFLIENQLIHSIQTDKGDIDYEFSPSWFKTGFTKLLIEVNAQIGNEFGTGRTEIGFSLQDKINPKLEIHSFPKTIEQYNPPYKFSLSGTTEDAYGIQKVEWRYKGNMYREVDSYNPNTKEWNIHSELPGEGEHKIDIRSTDINGNITEELVEIEAKKKGAKSSKEYPALLLPLRLETQYEHNQLKLRVYPDQVFLNTHNSQMTKSEFEAGKHFVFEIEVDKKKSIWRALVQGYGAERATWIVHTIKEECKNQDFEYMDLDKEIRNDTEEISIKAELNSLPERFFYCILKKEDLENGRNKDFLKTEPFVNKVDQNLTYLETTGGSAIGSSPDNNPGFFGARSSWVFDYDEAVIKGMAQSINISESQLRGARIIVVGLNNLSPTAKKGSTDVLKSLINQHYYTEGVSFPEYGTPTNNTDEVRAGYSENIEDWEQSYELAETGLHLSHEETESKIIDEVLPSAGPRFGYAVGIGADWERLKHIDGADNRNDSFSKIAYSGVKSYWMENGLQKIGLFSQDLQTHYFEHLVRNRGMFPLIRLGTQPYGILPVSKIQNWKPGCWSDTTSDCFGEDSKNVQSTESPLSEKLVKLFKAFIKVANDLGRVPRVGEQIEDPDGQLVKLLSMSPTSNAYFDRLFFDNPKILDQWDPKDTLENKAFKTTLYPNHMPLSLIEAWIDFVKKEVAEFEIEEFEKIKEFFGWFEDQQVELPYEEILSKIVTNEFENTVEPGVFEQHIREAYDLFSHRLDAWITSLSTKRLLEMRKAKPKGVCLGAFGWLDDFDPTPIEPKGSEYILAPSQGQAAAAAVLRNAFHTHNFEGDQNPFYLNLNSERVRNATQIIEGLQRGHSLRALLGYQFERALHERQLDHLIDYFRKEHPIDTIDLNNSQSTVVAENVVDGLELAHWWAGLSDGDRISTKKLMNGSDKELNDLAFALDGVSDLLIFESVYQMVQGNFSRASQALNAAAGNDDPQELEAISTPIGGFSYKKSVCLFFPKIKIDLKSNATNNKSISPRAIAEPSIAAWFENLLLGKEGNKKFGCKVRYSRNKEDSAGPQEDFVFIHFKKGLEIQFKKNPTITEGNKTILPFHPIDLLYEATAPAEGQLTNIEQRIVYCVREAQGLLFDDEVTINPFLKSPDCDHSIMEAIELARQVRQLLVGKRVLKAEDLKLSANIDADPSNDQEQLALANYMDEDHLFFAKLKATESNITPDNALEFLHNASLFGISGCIPRAKDDPNIMKMAERAAIEFKHMSEGKKTLFGDDFLILDYFQLENDTVHHQIKYNDKNGIRTFLQQASYTHPSLQVLEDTLIMSEAWQGDTSNGLTFNVRQLSTEEVGGWIGLDKEEWENSNKPNWPPSGDLKSMIIGWGGFESMNDENDEEGGVFGGGLVLEEWDEFIPDETVDANIAFRYDGPNTQAPQSWLLAVPAEPKAENSGKYWYPGDLAEIVSDTLDLAKIRAVDPEAMMTLDEEDAPAILKLFPSLLFPKKIAGEDKCRFEDLVENWLKETDSLFDLTEECLIYKDAIYKDASWNRSQYRISNPLIGKLNVNWPYPNCFLTSSGNLKVIINDKNPSRILIRAGWKHDESATEFIRIVITDSNDNIIELPVSFTEKSSPEKAVVNISQHFKCTLEIGKEVEVFIFKSIIDIKDLKVMNDKNEVVGLNDISKLEIKGAINPLLHLLYPLS